MPIFNANTSAIIKQMMEATVLAAVSGGMKMECESKRLIVETTNQTKPN